MADRGEMAGRPVRAPMPSRARKRWAAAAGVAGLWVILLAGTHSIVGGTVLLLLIAALAAGVFAGLRAVGIDRNHPWVRRAATRPWRDGREVLQVALRHVQEVFVVTPSGSLLAPNLVELRMNPADVASLTELMELEVANSSASELYASKVTEHAARLANGGPVEVSIVADPAVPAGRYRFRQGRRGQAGSAAGAAGQDGAASRDGAPELSGQDGAPSPPYAVYRPGLPYPTYPQDPPYPTYPQDRPGPDSTRAAGPAAATLVRDVMTVAAPAPVPPLRLVTKGAVAETRRSGARAGRGSTADLALPDEPTVSRVHAEFTCTDGQWRITSLGRNGVWVNDTQVTRDRVIRNGDLIRWGPHAGALVSRVEVG